MVKKNISFYTDKNRIPLSLGYLSLKPKKFVEDIFFAVEDSENFADLTDKLHEIIADKMEVNRISEKYILYDVYDAWDNHRFLKFTIQPRESKLDWRQLAITLVEDMKLTIGTYETIDYLYQSGYTREDLINEIGFKTDDVNHVIEEEEL